MFGLLALLLSISVAHAQDIPDVTGGEANPIMMLDDITAGLLADDQLATNGLESAQSLLDDLTSGATSGGDPIAPDAPGDPSTNDPGVPVDGGLSLLLAAGAAYGARRLRKSTMEKKKAKSGR